MTRRKASTQPATPVNSTPGIAAESACDSATEQLIASKANALPSQARHDAADLLGESTPVGRIRASSPGHSWSSWVVKRPSETRISRSRPNSRTEESPVNPVRYRTLIGDETRKPSASLASQRPPQARPAAPGIDPWRPFAPS